MKTIKTTVDGKNDQGTPKWIKVKVSHLINSYFWLIHVYMVTSVHLLDSIII